MFLYFIQEPNNDRCGNQEPKNNIILKCGNQEPNTKSIEGAQTALSKRDDLYGNQEPNIYFLLYWALSGLFRLFGLSISTRRVQNAPNTIFERK